MSTSTTTKQEAGVSKEQAEKIKQVQIRILTCVRQAQGKQLLSDDLEKMIKDVPGELYRDALNALLRVVIFLYVNNNIKQRLQMLRMQGQILFKEISPELAQKFQDLTSEDMMVYNFIEQAANKGIWKKDISIRSKLQSKIVDKSLKTLKAKQLIKMVKHVHGKNKQIYMLEHLEPSREITGGVWYKDAEFNTKLIDTLQMESVKFVHSKKVASTAEVLEHVRGRGFSDVDLRVEDMQCIMNALIYDGLIEEVPDANSTSKDAVLYKASGSIMQSNPFTEIPCATCPVFNQCTDNGDINPKSCTYLKKWMEFDF